MASNNTTISNSVANLIVFWYVVDDIHHKRNPNNSKLNIYKETQ